jgi:hypothetical protein
MIELELKLVVRNAPDAMDTPQVQINRLNVGFYNLHMTKNSPERIDDVSRIKISGCDLMQHWCKENEILATDQRHLYVRSTREPFVEVHRRIKPGKSATGNDYSSRLHAVTANRKATREIEILLMDAIIQSFSHLFLKLFSVQILENLRFSSGFVMRRTIKPPTQPRPVNG